MADRETEAAATALLELCKARNLMVATAESCAAVAFIRPAGL